MSDVGKVYTPTIIPETPFPQQDSPPIVAVQEATTQKQDGATYSSAPVASQPFPKKPIAKELLSSALNTRSKKIIKQWEFTPSGAIQIGKFDPGVSGDIRISPDGMVARNITGDNTIVVDGETGDVTISGTMRASRFENDNFTVDEEGNVIANSIKVSSQDINTSGANSNQQINTSTFEDVNGGEKVLTLQRKTIVLFLVSAVVYVQNKGVGGNWDGYGELQLLVDGVVKAYSRVGGGENSLGQFGAVSLTPMSMFFIGTVDAGTKTIKVQGKCDQNVGSTRMIIYGIDVGYVTLGND